MKFFLLSTEHLTEHLWFRDDEDFRTGMNFTAIVAHSLNISVLAFILMSNHVHFVLSCYEADAVGFATDFKKRYSQYYRNKYGVQGFLTGNRVDIRQVDMCGESLERAIAYVQMNCVAANICSHPSQYPWGTGAAFFNQTPDVGVELGSMRIRARRRLLHSKNTLLPNEFMINGSGFINPSSYISKGFVERLYRSPARYNYFLHSSSKAKHRLEESPMPSFRDQNILAAVIDLCQSLFRKTGLNELSEEQLTELLRQLRYRFNADVAQLARVLSISYERIAGLLDRA